MAPGLGRLQLSWKGQGQVKTKMKSWANFFFGPESRNVSEFKLLLYSSPPGSWDRGCGRNIPRCSHISHCTTSRKLGTPGQKLLHLGIPHKEENPTWLKIVPRGHKNDDCLLPSSHTWKTYDVIWKCKVVNISIGIANSALMTWVMFGPKPVQIHLSLLSF